MWLCLREQDFPWRGVGCARPLTDDELPRLFRWLERQLPASKRPTRGLLIVREVSDISTAIKPAYQLAPAGATTPITRADGSRWFINVAPSAALWDVMETPQVIALPPLVFESPLKRAFSEWLYAGHVDPSAIVAAKRASGWTEPLAIWLDGYEPVFSAPAQASFDAFVSAAQMRRRA